MATPSRQATCRASRARASRAPAPSPPSTASSAITSSSQASATSAASERASLGTQATVRTCRASSPASVAASTRLCSAEPPGLSIRRQIRFAPSSTASVSRARTRAIRDASIAPASGICTACQPPSSDGSAARAEGGTSSPRATSSGESASHCTKPASRALRAEKTSGEGPSSSTSSTATLFRSRSTSSPDETNRSPSGVLTRTARAAGSAIATATGGGKVWRREAISA